MMAPETQQATQQATQPYEDPRRQGRNLSDMSEHEASDIICVLHSNSPRAASAVRATMLHSPEHILQNEDLEGLTEDDLLLDPHYESSTRDIALRMSSTVKVPKDGFRFGRNPQSCDILLSENLRDKLISNTHFRIYVHEQGSLMIEDMSTNGTIVDDDFVKIKDKFGNPLHKPGKRVLTNGSTITVLVGSDKSEIKFIVRIPNRTDYETLYEQKLRRYLEVRGVAANFSSVRESSFGNFWTGGSRYNFTGLLGKGAFASVYRIQTKNEGTIYAAKEIDKRRFVKNGLLDVKFDNELQIMRRLKHPNIVEYIDCQSYKNWIYIIMEYVPHGELSKELASRGQLPEHEVQQITKQTLRALDYLHRQGVTHRDIKPDNILIAQREPLVVKLSDFGLSKSVVDQETFLKTFCGTLLYCAPEVYPDYGTYTSNPAVKRRRHGDGPARPSPYDSSADMWSFGAVVFHLLCGRAPIIGRGENGGAQMLNNIMTKDVDFGPLRDLSISEEAVDFISALLNRHPHMRPKEADCFQHPWLRSVPDVANYGNVTGVGTHLRGALNDVDELDEDEADDELMDDLNKLTQGGQAPTSSSTPSSPERALKKPRMQRAESTIPEQILYPMLPPGASSTDSGPKAAGEPRLFGEITESVLKSSGLFGMAPTGNKTAELPRIQEQLELVSMNDFAQSTESNVDNNKGASDQRLHPEQTLGMQGGAPGSAASLLGAEAQMGHMNMGSPDVHVSDAGTPDTTNPITPQTRELSPDKAANEAVEEAKADEREASNGSIDGSSDRRISVQLLADDAAFAEEQKARQEARLVNAHRKAETFHPSLISAPTTVAATMAIPLAQTFHGATHPVEDFDHAGSLWTRSRVVSLFRSDEQQTASQPLFGVLKPLQGSFSNQSIKLASRSTLWGRGEGCNCRYHDLQDVRVPKFGLKVIFFAHGIEQAESDGLDWTQVPNIRTIVATSATRGVQVNGVHLAQQSPDGGAALFGKIYTGDIITVLDGPRPGEFLKYEVEITFGGSAQRRPESEQPFLIQKEYKYHAQMKSHSHYGGMTEDTMVQKGDLVASNVVSVN